MITKIQLEILYEALKNGGVFTLTTNRKGLKSAKIKRKGEKDIPIPLNSFNKLVENNVLKLNKTMQLGEQDTLIIVEYYDYNILNYEEFNKILIKNLDEQELAKIDLCLVQPNRETWEQVKTIKKLNLGELATRKNALKKEEFLEWLSNEDSLKQNED